MAAPIATGRCFLLELPPEMRLRIYDFVFDGIDYSVAIDNSDNQRIAFKISPIDHGIAALLQTCKTVHGELVPILCKGFPLHVRFEHTNSPFQHFSMVDEKLAHFKHIWKNVQHIELELEISSDDSWVMRDVESVVNALEESQSLRSCSVQLSMERNYSLPAVINFLTWSCNEVLFRIPEESVTTTNTTREIVYAAIKTEAIKWR